MAGKVYLVTEGSYSDYHVCGAFSTRELAESFKELKNGEYGSAGIEEYELDQMPDVPQGMKPFRVILRGDKSSTRPCDYETIPYQHWGINGFICDVWATDEQHAVKIASEKRAYSLAMGLVWENPRSCYWQAKPPCALRMYQIGRFHDKFRLAILNSSGWEVRPSQDYDTLDEAIRHAYIDYRMICGETEFVPWEDDGECLYARLSKTRTYVIDKRTLEARLIDGDRTVWRAVSPTIDDLKMACIQNYKSQ